MPCAVLLPTASPLLSPYFGYSRQDRRPRSARVPISAKVVANMIAGVGIDRVLTLDLHADQIQGFFDFPVDNIYATPIILNDLLAQDFKNPVVVSPDVGGVLRARATAKQIDAKLAIIDKRRPRPNESEIMNIIGDSIEGCDCIIVDDMVDTAGTLANAATALKERKARTVTAYCTHAILSGNAIENIEKSGMDQLIVTDSVPLREAAKNCKKSACFPSPAWLPKASAAFTWKNRFLRCSSIKTHRENQQSAGRKRSFLYYGETYE